ncbi:glucose 1-dehydrogenase [Pseudooceanicola sp. CBS1P-1]|uniref:Glucose 1-dehydrogenase n=1 Tax=Pseudooceanicola albus TaxID=2692189 RepID=A0A6L7G7P8_9RHOB|nr:MULTISPECIES: glucose 1-dehydrogenase [Pseudooceanicola]MBT9385428.1 glucose 1-dehydrogenase [Pseudooceanicola endophyticus]MXN18713.1 glucose 1-dehydrogenase [Pseudooceanicola albus]
MDFSLTGKVAVVTGAGKGLGRAIALAYAEQGASVVVAARGKADLDTLVAEIEAKGGKALAVPTDVTSQQAVDALADAALSTFGKVDTWVNNAGGFIDGAMKDWTEVDAASLDAMWKLNVSSYVYGAQAAARAMKQGGTGGSLIFMSSLDALNACPGGEGCYGAAKMAITHIARTLAVELGRFGIRVNSIAPGIVQTPLLEHVLTSDEAIADKAKFYPLGRIGQPDDVAGAAVYLASDVASYVSGATLLVSGGAIFNSDPFRYLSALAEEA